MPTLEFSCTGIAPLRSAISGELVLLTDPGYDEARRAWNLAADQRPAAVVLAADADDVAATVRAVRGTPLRVAPQGTGHGAGALGDLRTALLVRTSALRDVSIDPVRRVARVGAGALWQDVVEAAAAHGLAALHGSAPDVGVVGYVLGGGIGWYARSHGLAANHVRAIELVTGEGDVVRVDAGNDPELFWGLRGGGSLGVVTAVELDLLPITRAYAGWLVFPWERAAEVLGAWSAWTRTAPESVTSVGRLLQLPPLPELPPPLRGRNLAVIEAAFLDEEAVARELLAPLRALGPELDTFADVPQTALATLHQDPPHPVPAIGDHTVLRAFPADAVSALVDVAGAGSGSPLLSVEVRHLGGAAGRPVPGGGARDRIDGDYALFAVGVPMAPGSAELIAAHAEAVVERLAPWASAVGYSNFAERERGPLHAPDVARRLAALRDRVDPERVIQGNHELD